MINNQEYITTELKKTLEKMVILSSTCLNNLIAMIVGIITSQSVVLSKISQELKDSYSLGTEDVNKDFKHVKQGLKFLHRIINPYGYEVTLNFFILLDQCIRFT